MIDNDDAPREDRDLHDRVVLERGKAELKAWDALSRYKFEMFGYWASSWVKHNQLLPRQSRIGNPFGDLVKTARARGFGPGVSRQGDQEGVSRSR